MVTAPSYLGAMGGTFLRKLLVLSCCVNIVLYLVIIYKCDVLPAGISHAPRATPISFNVKASPSSIEGLPPPIKTKHDNKTNNISSVERSEIKLKNILSSNFKAESGVVSQFDGDEGGGASGPGHAYYDPSFGIAHHTRALPPRDVQELFGRRVPNMAFYVWCGRGRTFLYKHFLSVYLVWYQLEPDVVEIHYEFLPLEDKYNTWLSWLRSNIPALSLQPLPSHVTGSKCGEASFGLSILADRGGLFLDNGAALYGSGNILTAILGASRSMSFYEDGTLAWAAAKADDSTIKRFLRLADDPHRQKHNNTSSYFHAQATTSHNNNNNNNNNKNNYSDERFYNCSQQDSQSALNQSLKEHINTPPLMSLISKRTAEKCILLCHKFPEPIHPVDFLQPQNGSATFRRALSEILYGAGTDNNETRRSTTRFETSGTCRVVNSGGTSGGTSRIVNSGGTSGGTSRIVHYVWFGFKNATFGMYLSFLSTVHIVQPDFVVIHTDMKLYGPYWGLIAKHSKVRVVYRESPRFVYNHRVFYTQHRSDVVRADVLDKYGGAYLDWDALWLKSPRDLFSLLEYGEGRGGGGGSGGGGGGGGGRGGGGGIGGGGGGGRYDIILSRDHMPRPPFPDSINMGVVIAKPRSKFIRAWRAAWIHYRSKDFLYNAVELPYKIYELAPHTSLLHDRLQVMCYFLKCHPLFHPDHKHWGNSQPFDWTRDVYAIHFTHPDPPAFQNETALVTSEGVFADIGRFIWDLRRKGVP